MARILLADDDARLLPVLALHLRNDDHDVVCAATVDEAIRAGVSARPDLMVLDIAMADADGASIQRRVSDHPALAPVPVIYLVEEDEGHGAARAARSTSASTIVRPVPARELLEKVRGAVPASAAPARAGRSSGARPAREPAPRR